MMKSKLKLLLIALISLNLNMCLDECTFGGCHEDFGKATTFLRYELTPNKQEYSTGDTLRIRAVVLDSLDSSLKYYWAYPADLTRISEAYEEIETLGNRVVARSSLNQIIFVLSVSNQSVSINLDIHKEKYESESGDSLTLKIN